MSVFMLDTDAVSSSSSSLSSIASQLDSIASSVSGYDTSCDEFDFSTPKSIIAENISASSIKVQNTISIIEGVVATHTALQNSLKFGANANKEEERKTTTRSSSSSSSSSSSRSGSSSQSSSSSRSGSSSQSSSSSSSSSSGYRSSSSGSYSGVSAATSGVAAYSASTGSYSNTNTVNAGAGGTVSASVGKIVTTGNSTKPVSELATQLKGVVVESKFQNTSYSPIDTSNVSSFSTAFRHIIESKDFKYSELGFATIGGMYVISCASSIGNVGEKIVLTLKDGSKIDCIIGQNTEDSGLHFFVKNGFDEEENSLPEDFLDNIQEIKNFGDTNYYVYGEKIKSAIEWALETASDDSHGYSQQSRWGSPSYDCSSFVISSFDAAGISVKDAGAGYTGNMKPAFTKSGFAWIPGDPNINDLQPGDVLLNEGQHTEMYIGYGLMVGAHGNFDSTGADSSGKEISVCTYSSYPWNGILRYVGDIEDKGDENNA